MRRKWKDVSTLETKQQLIARLVIDSFIILLSGIGMIAFPWIVIHGHLDDFGFEEVMIILFICGFFSFLLYGMMKEILTIRTRLNNKGK